jgi:glycosyltransferase involved in cell wall biosynthesis
MPKVTIAIPTHDMENARFFLTRCLDSILKQTHEDFDIVITDNSPTDKLKRVVQQYGMKIHYSLNPRRGATINTNEAIRQSKGELVKILHMDDYFAHKNALKDIVEVFDGSWLITGTQGNAYPYWTDDIMIGNNKLGSPSALTIKNENPLMFDEDLKWLFDCEYYKRLHDKFGEPTILDGVNVVIGVHDGQMTNLLTKEEKQQEEDLMKERYGL